MTSSDGGKVIGRSRKAAHTSLPPRLEIGGGVELGVLVEELRDGVQSGHIKGLIAIPIVDGVAPLHYRLRWAGPAISNPTFIVGVLDAAKTVWLEAALKDSGVLEKDDT